MTSENLNYGVVGNCQSAALISIDGSVEWLCLPHFASSSIFASLLDTEKGGCFSIKMNFPFSVQQNYEYKTPILRTTFTSHDTSESFVITDFMPRYLHAARGYHHPPELVRIVTPLKGTPSVTINLSPALNYGQHETTIIEEAAFLKMYSRNGKYDSAYLYSNLSNNIDIINGTHSLEKELYFVLSYNQKLITPSLEKAYLEYYRTKTYWLDWVERREWPLRYIEEVIRSAITIKLLTYQKTGAIIAAVTTSLPETIGEERNWDYRFCWIRDASMIISILTKLGDNGSAERFLSYIMKIIPHKDEMIQIMYGISGEKTLTETELPWLSGYHNSKPVRIGNAAYEQKQNDIYGVLLDVILKNFYYFSINIDQGEHLWTIVRNIARIVETHWEEPDMGIWEFRSQKQNFVFSKVLCWVAMDRAARIAELLEQRNYEKDWRICAKKIKTDIELRGWNDNLQAYTQSYENTAMDASNLLMCDYGFVEPDNPRFKSTVKKIRDNLCVNGLMYRYKNQDDFGMPKSSFTICTFWLIKALYKIGEKKEAISLYDDIIKHTNHLGLLSEDMDFSTKRLLGNFPQGYSHLALIDVAWEISNDALSKEGRFIHSLDNPHTEAL
ncbi:MAG: glycoside hydrolase family 15 protein [Spirochaetes bacterium]|jgi:GH15 family glucan-1,4-alpha-glucosidase|nr:glycoside hydrolase family 15 protein [Spirochaetota bacterium]